MGSDGGGGILAFLLEGLQSAICRSQELRTVLLASTRRQVRLLSVVEYDIDELETPETKEVCYALSLPAFIMQVAFAHDPPSLF